MQNFQNTFICLIYQALIFFIRDKDIDPTLLFKSAWKRLLKTMTFANFLFRNHPCLVEHDKSVKCAFFLNDIC